jgi:hypothetical protein
MAEGRVEEAWQRTSALMALIANTHRDPKKGRWFQPADFNPFGERSIRSEAAVRVGIEVLKDVFVDRRMPKVN